MPKRRKKGAVGAASLVLPVLFLCIHLFPVPAYGSSTPPKQGEVERLIKLIETRYGRMRGLAADFEQVHSGAGLRTRRERGRIFLARPRRMRWEYDPRPGKLFIVNEREVWLYVPADREATHASADRVADARFPFLFLLGGSNLRRLFRSITLVEKGGDGGAPSDLRALRLVPRGSASGLREIFLEVFADGRISKLRMIDEAGAVSEISLSNVREDWVAPADAFEFRPPSGVTVRRLN
ncbi:MAG TPA: outer membrane lipoprotein carrier protein LolA [Pyrinomonadaceae bacterium]|jgi:chaperone LolA|nr:outer membrane lipoprotein carrier protein LolA [Pyrinomonadaceae bacterium]